MKEIFSKQNQIIKDLKKQKLKNRFLLFLDNPKSINDACLCGLMPKLMLVDKEKMAKLALPECTEIILTNQSIIKEFADTQTPQGVVAVYDFLPKTPKKPNGNFLVLDGLQDPGNVGTLLRSALATDFKDVFLLDSVSLTNPKVIRSSMSSILRLNIYEISRADFVQFAKQNSLTLLSADMDGENIFEFSAQSPVGLVVGSEGKGLSHDLLLLSKTKVSVPMSGGLESLNAGVAGSIIMFQIQNK